MREVRSSSFRFVCGGGDGRSVVPLEPLKGAVAEHLIFFQGIVEGSAAEGSAAVDNSG